MNFYNDDEKKDGAPVIPSTASTFKKTSAFGKAPMFSRAAGSITDRLKNLSRKDMAFVAIGLSVLVMTPVAEYMMSQPSQDNMLKEGFGNRGKEGSSGLYEPGINGLSQGSPDGSGEVITPLSSRDPASLILGSQPAAPVMPPSAPPSTSFRDAMKESGRNAFTEAAKSAGAPTPIPKMQAGLRSLSFGGGEGTRTSGSMGGGKIIDDARSASNKAVKRSMLGPVAMAGYKGVASNTPNSSSKGAFEKLRAQADKSAGNFSGGSATTALDRAAADAAEIGKGAGGMGAGGDSDKTTKPSNSTNKNEHNNSGETLDQMMAKKRMEKALEWEFFKKYDIPKQIITAMLTGFNNALTKAIERNANGAFGNGAGAPQVYICVQLKDKTGDCMPGNMKSGVRSSDEKTVDGWISRGTCACGPMTPEEFAAAGGTGDGTPVTPPVTPGTTPVTPGTTPGTTPGQTPVTPDPAVAVGLTEMFSSYDTTLTGMLEDMKLGAAATKGDVLLKHSIAIAGAFPKLRADAVAMAAKNGAENARSGDVAAYKTNIEEAKKQVLLVKASYESFIGKYNKVLAAAKTVPPTLAMGSTKTGEFSMKVDVTPSMITLLEGYKTTFDTYENGCMVKADEKIAYNEKALEVFGSQLDKVGTAADGVSTDYTGNVNAAAEKISTELGAIQIPAGGQPAPKDQERIIALFKDLTGAASAIPAATPVVPPVDPGTTGTPVTAVAESVSAPVGDFVAGQTEGALGNPPLLDKPLMWRGLPVKNPIVDGKFNHADALKAEATAWVATTPRSKGTIDKIVDLDNMEKDSLLAPAVRGSLYIPADAKASQIDPKAAAGLLQPIKDKMDEVRKQLEEWKINLDNPTGDANPGGNTNPAVTVDPALAGRYETLKADALLTGSKYEAATAVVNKGLKGSKAEYARANYKDMTTSKAEVDRIVGQLAVPGAKPTKEQLDALERNLTNFNAAYADFRTNANVTTPVPTVIKPPVPAVVNNITVVATGGNSTAIANATAGANTVVKPPVNNTTVNNHVVNNNTVVKPPVVVPPVVHHTAPKPVTAPKEFSVSMPGGTFMKLVTNNTSGASATYYGGHREGFTSWLYKYEVVCVRSGNVFKVTRAQRTKALFTTGVNVGGPEPVYSIKGDCK